MAQHRVLITTAYLGPGDEIHNMLVDAGCDVTYSRPQDREDPGATLAAALADVHAVIAGTDPFTADVIDSAPSLGIIARTGVGYDNVDLRAAERRGVTVCSTPGANSQSVAELTIGLMIGCARHIVPSAIRVRDGGWAQTSGRELGGSTLGVVGLGTIGKSVASAATALGMRVIAHDAVLDAEFLSSAMVCARALNDLLAESDFVSLHLSLTPETHHLIDAAALARMKPTAYLINTARGGVIDEAALCDALRAGRLAGAALDVLEIEPPAPDDPLRATPNLLLTPHIAGATAEARSRSSHLAATQVIDYLSGRRVAYPVAATASPGS